jgi:hypothetical protein
MGAIQNEVNQLLGTAAVVAGGVKHLKGQEKEVEAKKEENALNEKLKIAEAKVQEAELGEKIYNQGVDIKQQKKDLKTAKAGIDPEAHTVYGGVVFNEEEMKNDIAKRQLALRTAEEKQKAMKLQRESFRELIGGKK